MGNTLKSKNPKSSDKKNKKTKEIFCYSQFKAKFFEQVFPTLSPQIVDKINNYDWVKFQITEQWKKVFEGLEKTQCTRFIPSKSEKMPMCSATILTQISHIALISLVSLDLSNHGIPSIEVIASLNMDQIQSVKLHTNFITNLQALNKIQWNRLQKLIIYKNKLPKADISRVFGKSLVFFYPNRYGEKAQIEDARTLVKIQSEKIDVIVLCADNTVIQNKKTYQVLKNRYRTAYINNKNGKNEQRLFLPTIEYIEIKTNQKSLYSQNFGLIID